jgi:hypothetical protein
MLLRMCAAEKLRLFVSRRNDKIKADYNRLTAQQCDLDVRDSRTDCDDVRGKCTRTCALRTHPHTKARSDSCSSQNENHIIHMGILHISSSFMVVGSSGSLTLIVKIDAKSLSTI